MIEGILFLHEDQITIKHFSHGELVYEKLQPGQSLEIFQNGYWHNVTIKSVTDEPFISDWNYGDCIGCDARISK